MPSVEIKSEDSDVAFISAKITLNDKAASTIFNGYASPDKTGNQYNIGRHFNNFVTVREEEKEHKNI